MKPPIDLRKINKQAAEGIKVGFVDDVRRQATPYTVICCGLTEDDLGQRMFSAELQARCGWIGAYCKSTHEVEPIRDGMSCLVGRRYRFEDADEAFAFRLRFT